jgi:hypothetical protein
LIDNGSIVGQSSWQSCSLVKDWHGRALIIAGVYVTAR